MLTGECKPIIADYLRCLRRVKGTNDQECRLMAKAYLQCRMDQYVSVLIGRRSSIRSYVWSDFALTALCSSNLMAPDEFRNLGFADDEKAVAIPKHAGGATSNRTRDDGKKIF